MGHWYTKEGKPMHRLPKSTGPGTRPTTIVDARERSLYPSATTVLNVLDKPGLNNWKLREACLVAATSPKGDEETAYQYSYRCQRVAREQARAAANRGEAIHSALESWLSGNTMDNDYFEIIRAVRNALREMFDGFDESTKIAEQIVVDPTLGYGGKYDLMLPDYNAMIDFKTKDFDDNGMQRIRGYDDQGMQLAAYARAEKMYPWQSSVTRNGPMPKLVNIFVSRDNPGLVKTYTHDDPDRLEQAFTACCDLYHALNPGLR